MEPHFAREGRGARESVVKHNCLFDGWEWEWEREGASNGWELRLYRGLGLSPAAAEGDKRGRLSQTNMFLVREGNAGDEAGFTAYKFAMERIVHNPASKYVVVFP